MTARFIALQGSHPTVDAWLIRSARSATILLTNFALPLHPIDKESVTVSLKGAFDIANGTLQPIDSEHANPKPQTMQFSEGKSTFDVELPPQSVATIEFAC